MLNDRAVGAFSTYINGRPRPFIPDIFDAQTAAAVTFTKNSIWNYLPAAEQCDKMKP